MCEPASIVMGTVGVGMQLASAWNAAEAEKQSAAQAAKIAAENRRLANQAADDAIQRVEAEAGRITQKEEQVVGVARARAAATGLDVGAGGSVQRTLTDSAVMAAVDKQIARNNAAREAWGFRTQGLNYQRQGQAAVNQANAAADAAILSGVGQSVVYGVKTLGDAGAFQKTPKAPYAPQTNEPN